MDGEGLIKELDQNKDNKLSFEVENQQLRCFFGPDFRCAADEGLAE